MNPKLSCGFSGGILLESTMRNPLLMLAAVALVAGPAAAQDPVRPGREAGLGITGPEMPDELARIQADPYAPPRAPGCEGVAAELADLEGLLGPDVDVAREQKTSAGETVGGAIKSLIPYRGVVRLVTGAGRKEQALVDASMAGSARRGYLRGLQASMSCNTGAPAVQATAADASANAPAAEPVKAAATTSGYVPALDDPLATGPTDTVASVN